MPCLRQPSAVGRPASCSFSIPIFAYRHYVRDGGKFPDNMLADMGLEGQDLGEKKAGMWPYIALAAGAVVVLWANWFFVMPVAPP